MLNESKEVSFNIIQEAAGYVMNPFYFHSFL